MDFLTLYTSYNQRASNVHNFVTNRREMSKENVFGIWAAFGPSKLAIFGKNEKRHYISSATCCKR